MEALPVPVYPGSVFFLVFETRALHDGVRAETAAVHLFTEDDLKWIQSPLEPWSSNLIGGGLYWQ